MADYVNSSVLQQIAEGDESSSSDVYDRLASAVSRMFDRECEVSNDFFAAAVSGPSGVTMRAFASNGTEYVKIDPYEAGSITEVLANASPLPLADSQYYTEREGYLVFRQPVPEFTTLAVTARFGFPVIPVDITQACIEQALFLFRRKDLAFADMSGVSAAALAAEFTPTFLAVTQRYREIYSSRNYFA